MIDFVFLHSYTSKAMNWYAVMIGKGEYEGRLIKAKRLAKSLGVPLIANDKCDTVNHEIFEKEKIVNIGTAICTLDEINSALQRSRNGKILFVTSPDHLPRVVRDVLAAGSTNAFFSASETYFSEGGPDLVEINEPPHK